MQQRMSCDLISYAISVGSGYCEWGPEGIQKMPLIFLKIKYIPQSETDGVPFNMVVRMQLNQQGYTWEKPVHLPLFSFPFPNLKRQHKRSYYKECDKLHEFC